jgi:hypothetical protein
MRTLQVAIREFNSVVLTKGFLLGIVLVPLISAIATGGAVLAAKAKAPKIEGRVIVIDRSALASGYVTTRLSPAAQKAEAERQQKAVQKAADKVIDSINLPADKKDAAKAQMSLSAGAADKTADLTIETRDPSTDIESIKKDIRASDIKASRKPDQPLPLLAAVIIPKESVTPGADGKYADLDVFVNPKLDFEVQNRIQRGAADGVVDTRLATDARITSSGMAAATIRDILDPPGANAVTVTADGERKSMGPIAMLIPVGFMILLMMSVMTAGSYLMTALVEEKSSRVMEVLLSAVSPLQLMFGKIMGQMAVGLVILIVYGGLGLAGLVAFALMDLLEPIKLVYFVCFFLISFLTIASIMAAVGSAVNDMREAQTLQAPIIMLIMVPWFMWSFVQRAPNSTLAVILGFTPLLNPFTMVIRLGGSEPIPTWQVLVSILIGAATSAFMVWAAAKIFRIGVLMYGKPPNFATLIKWIRMA